MPEPAVKRRTLTKVRRQYLHKHPFEDEEEAPNAILLATPEQLNQDTVRLLEPSLGLVESNRTLQAGAQFLNTHYKISSVQIENHFQCKAVTLGIEMNQVYSLPLEYCAKRLESYGDLDLATWAQRVRKYRENYPRLMEAYFDLMNPDNPQTSSLLEAGRAQAALACREIERKYVYCKAVLRATRNSMIPILLAYGESFLKELGHSVDSFLEWTRESGIPKIFGGDSTFNLELSKDYLTSTNTKQALYQEGPEYDTSFNQVGDVEKKIKAQVISVIDPTPEGFLVHIYVVVKGGSAGTEDFNSKGTANCKIVKKEDFDTADDSNETSEENQEDQADSEAD